MTDAPVSNSPILPLAVLVAETHPLARVSLAELLQLDGYRVFQAPDRDAAISYIDKNLDLAVVLADLEMPRWQSLVSHAQVTVPEAMVLGMARFHSAPGASELERRGIHVCLEKPLMYEDVRQSIVNYFGGEGKK
jgi:DNA-binding NtrC family response regulator